MRSILITVWDMAQPFPSPPLGIPKGDACYPLELVRLPEQERDARRGGAGVGVCNFSYMGGDYNLSYDFLTMRLWRSKR